MTEERLKSRLLILLAALFSTTAYGHGEDKPGPHGGFIRMPGPYHIELVPAGSDRLQVYLLDLEIKNPSIKDSSVSIRVNSKADATCKTAEGPSFICSLPKGMDLATKGSLAVTSRREGQVGAEMIYKIPLSRR